MKKFSILSLAVLLAAGTGFAGKSLPVSGKVVKDSGMQMLNLPLKAAEDGIKSMAKAPMKAAIASDNVSGAYTWSYYNLLQGGTAKVMLDMELVDEATGEVAITGWLPGENFVVKGVVDYEEGILSLPNNQYLGEDSQFGDPTYFYIKDVDADGNILEGASVVESVEGVFDGNAFVFEPLEIWAIGDPSAENLGWWRMGAECVLSQPIVIDEEQVGKWEDVGIATIEDAWITPSYNFTDGSQVVPSEYPFSAMLQRSVDNENLYRLWAPYHAEDWLLVDLNSSAYQGQIVFDITDPAHVIVKAGNYAGFANSNGEFCVFGMLGWQIYYYGEDWNDEYLPGVYEFMEEHDQPFDTFENGVLSVNRSVFDIDIECTRAYTWLDNDYVVSKITFPAGTAVEGVDVENAPVKYYNLQGVEVANPAAGQLVICRQGDKATKKIMK